MSDRSQSDSVASQKCGRRRAAECRRGNCAGFTYIGLLILIAMMGFALTVVAEVWQTVQTRDKEEELLFVGNQFRRALAAYNANGGRYPHQLEDLLKDPAFPGVRRYLRQIYRDPITGSTEWGLLKPDGNSIVGVYSLSEAKPLKQAGFSLADESFEAKDKYSEWVFTGKGALGSPATLTPAPGQTPGISPAAPGAAQAFGAPAAAPAAQAAPATATPANSGTTSVDAGQDAAGRFGPRGRR
jgi:type II secretory pathway pseudopilin PulG